jgi:uncharacterized protein YdeI (BOF family)
MRNTILLLASLALVAACGAKDNRFGEKIPENTARAAMSDVLKEPEPYDGKPVVMDGMFMNRCCEFDFVFASGTDSLEVIVSDACPMPPKGREKTNARVYGVVQVRDGGVTIEAKGIEF